MVKHKCSDPDVAKARILEIRNAARDLSINTQGDPAECIFELLCAALLVSYEALPLRPPAELIAEVAPSVEATVKAWFPDELKKFRCSRV